MPTVTRNELLWWLLRLDVIVQDAKVLCRIQPTEIKRWIEAHAGTLVHDAPASNMTWYRLNGYFAWMPNAISGENLEHVRRLLAFLAEITNIPPLIVLCEILGYTITEDTRAEESATLLFEKEMTREHVLAKFDEPKQG